MELEHHCQAWPLDIVMPEDEASSGLEFVFEMEVTRICVHDFEGHSGNLQLDTVNRETFRRTFRVKHDDLSNESTATSTVSNMLYDLSFHPDIQVFMISKILDCASDMLRQKHYAGRKVLRMCVAIEVTHEEPDSVDAYVLGLPVDEQVYGLVPASKSAIEALEKMKIEDTNEACTVCLEDFHASAAARMPCLHLFHHKCIVNWLQTSNFCPLCRLELAGRE